MKALSQKNAIVLDVQHLTKDFFDNGKVFKAVNDVSFSVHQGEIVGLLGPNGAGKTTTIQMLLGLMNPSSGTIHYFDKNLTTHREEILQRVNHASGYGRMPWRLTVRENLTVFGHLYGVKNVKARVEEIAEAFEGTNLLSKWFQDLSAGQMTKVMLMKAFISEPDIVLLDEPTASLDPDIAEKIREYILKECEKRNLTLLITSHNMREVELMCDRVIFLQQGTVKIIDTPKNLAKQNRMSVLKLVVVDGLKRFIEVLDKHKYTYSTQHRFIEINIPTQEVGPLLSEMGSKGLQYSDIEIERPSLEDFFLTMSKE